jgi:cytochrome c556
MFVMGNHFGRIGAMVQGKVPFDAAQAAANAEIVAGCPSCPSPGSWKARQAPNSKAKPEIWTERAKFDAGAKKMQEKWPS